MKTQFYINACEAFLADTIRTYSKPGTRSTFPYGGCSYRPAVSSSPGCAIGRHIDNKKLCEQFDNTPLPSVDKPAIYDNLGWLRFFEPLFLARVQWFHDDPKNWCGNWLSDRGELSVSSLCHAHRLDFNRVISLAKS